MRKRTALFFAIYLCAAFPITACSSTEQESVETEERWDLEVPETEGGEAAEVTDDFSYITDLINVPEDCYILAGSSDIDYEDGLVVRDPDLITGIITDDSDVDLSAPGVYTVAYTLIIDDDVLGEEPVEDVMVYRTVEVVDDDRAVSLAAEGKLIWGSKNEVLGICGTEDYGISTMPLYISYTVEDITDDVATLFIENYSGYEITYGLYFDLEAEKEEEWVLLERLEDVAFEDAEYTLADQSEAEIKCDLAPYGKLPDGNYRILKDDIYVEFTMENGQLASDDEP